MRRLPVHGLMAEFPDEHALLDAARRSHAAGYRNMDAYSPLPVEGLAETLGMPRTRVPLVVFIGGLVGCIGGFFLQYWISAIDYPINVGGRPYNSWPSFIPVTFELTILCAAVAALFGMLAMNGLPSPYHPVFNVPQFALASQDRFFLCIQASDPKFDREATASFLYDLRPTSLTVVER